MCIRDSYGYSIDELHCWIVTAADAPVVIDTPMMLLATVMSNAPDVTWRALVGMLKKPRMVPAFFFASSAKCTRHEAESGPRTTARMSTCITSASAVEVPSDSDPLREVSPVVPAVP